MAHAGADLDRVPLDLHPPAAAVAELAPRHLAIERLSIKLQAGRHALENQFGVVRERGEHRREVAGPDALVEALDVVGQDGRVRHY